MTLCETSVVIHIDINLPCNFGQVTKFNKIVFLRNYYYQTQLLNTTYWPSRDNKSESTITVASRLVPSAVDISVPSL
jgi:hypothetical protein